MANKITLGDSQPVTEDKYPLKVGGEVSSLEISKTGSGARVTGDLSVTDNIYGDTKYSSKFNITGDFKTILTGTVTVSNGSLVVEGSGTAFDTELNVGDAIKILGQTFTVLSITDADTLGLNSAYYGDELSGVTAYTDNDLLIVRSGDNIDRIKITKTGDLRIEGDLVGDYFNINTGFKGATTITTVDDTDANADLTLDIDGDIEINPAAGSIVSLVSTVTSQNALDVQATALTTGTALNLNVDDSLTSATTKSLLTIDYDKSGVTASSVLNQTTGITIDLADAATNHSSGVVGMIGMQIDIDSASEQGIIKQVGLILNVAADNIGDAATTTGIEMEVDNSGTDLMIKSSANTDDYFTIQTIVDGETTLTTVEDGVGSTAHLNMVADGNFTVDAEGVISLDAQGGNITLLDGGSTFIPTAASDATTKTYVDDHITLAHRMRYYVNALTINHYYENSTDTSDSMAKWDDTIADPTTVSNRDLAATYIVPFACTLKGFESIGTTFTSSEGWTTHLWTGTPNLETTSGTTMAEACSATSDNNTAFEYEIMRATCSVALSTGDVILTTIRRTAPSSTLLNGTITFYLERA